MQPNNKGMIRKSGSRFSGKIMLQPNKGMTGKACHRALIRWGKYRVLENIAFRQRVGFPLRKHDIFLQRTPFRAAARCVYARCAAIGPAE
jgi:hypothetical protein